jgi:hypothetical protein
MRSRVRRALGAAALGAVLIAPAGAAGATESDVPPAVRDAVRTLAAERHGVTGFHRHFASDQRAPGHNERTQVDSARLRDDGKLVEIRLYRRSVNDAPTSAQDLAKQQAELDKTPPSEDYRLPVTEAALSEYRFGAATQCDGCGEGVVEVPFTSRKRDDSHGDGALRIDERGHRFVRIAFHPSALPKEADSGSITVTFGRALPDLWDVVEEKDHYTGHLLFIHGTYDATATLSGYVRFESLEAGRKAVAAGI